MSICRRVLRRSLLGGGLLALGVLQPAQSQDTPAAADATPIAVRQSTVVAMWRAASGRAHESYSEYRFEPMDLRFGERFYIERVCVSDPRKLIMLSYTDVTGRTDIALPLGDRGVGTVDPSDASCTLFNRFEIRALEKCKCWFQCADEQLRCAVSGYATRPRLLVP